MSSTACIWLRGCCNKVYDTIATPCDKFTCITHCHQFSMGYFINAADILFPQIFHFLPQLIDSANDCFTDCFEAIICFVLFERHITDFSFNVARFSIDFIYCTNNSFVSSLKRSICFVLFERHITDQMLYILTCIPSPCIYFSDSPFNTLSVI